LEFPNCLTIIIINYTPAINALWLGGSSCVVKAKHQRVSRAAGRRQGGIGGGRASVGGVHERKRSAWQRTSLKEEALATPVVVARFLADQTTSNGGRTHINHGCSIDVSEQEGRRANEISNI
jgi:hypothetical protein